MPFLAPVIGAAIGGLAATTLGTAIIGAGLSVAMGAISARLAPKSKTEASSARGANLSLTVDAQAPRILILGEAAIAGSLAYHHTYNETANLQYVLPLADHECEALTGIWINGEPVTWNSGTGEVDEYPGLIITWHSGAWGQSADTDLIAESDGAWTSDDRGRGVAYVTIDLGYDAELYKGGLPQFLFKVRGAKLYDWRKDSTAGGSGSHRWGQPETYEWSDNPVVCWYNYRRGIFLNGVREFGMATPADAIPLAAATAAANACDEAVDLHAGGTEKRYRVSAAIPDGTVHREVLRELVSATAGEEIDTGGELIFAPGIAQAPVMALTEGDMLVEAATEWVGKQSRKELINSVFGSWRDPVQRFEAIDLAPRISSADVATDGTRLDVRYDLDMVPSGTQAQRVLEILRRRARRQGVFKATFRATACVLESGDWITLTSERYGWETKTFEVVTSAVGPDLSTELVLREIDVDVYDWDPETDEINPGDIVDLPAGGGGMTSIAGLDVDNILVVSAESADERPGLQVTWTPIADPSVIRVEIQYRRQGDTVPQGTRLALDPSAGEFAWIDGILGGTTYEIRARPVTQPPRAVSWSAWISPSVATAPQVVDVGVLIPAPESVGPEHLSAQTLHELRLSTALAEMQGSVDEAIADALEWIRQAQEAGLRAQLLDRATRTMVRTETLTRQSEDEALAQQISIVAAGLGDAEASIVNEQIARINGDDALASSLSLVSSTVGDHTTSIGTLQSSVNGLNARWAVAINANGQLVGLIQMDGSDSESAVKVLADKFQVFRPDGTGSGVQVFTTGMISGASAVGINGNLVLDGSILARHIDVATLSAISATMGEVIGGIFRNSANTSWINMTTGAFQFTSA